MASTALGNEVCVDVVKAFLGVWAPTPNAVPDGPNNAVGASQGVMSCLPRFTFAEGMARNAAIGSQSL
jgi:hypothetical protein